MSDGSGWQRGLLSELTSDQRLAVFDAWELLSSPTDHRPPAHTSCLYSRHQQLSLWLCQIGDATSVISLLGDGSQEEAVSRTPSGPEPPAAARWVIITSLIMCETRDRFMFIKTLFTINIHHYHWLHWCDWSIQHELIGPCKRWHHVIIVVWSSSSQWWSWRAHTWCVVSWCSGEACDWLISCGQVWLQVVVLLRFITCTQITSAPKYFYLLFQHPYLYFDFFYELVSSYGSLWFLSNCMCLSIFWRSTLKCIYIYLYIFTVFMDLSFSLYFVFH